MSFTAVIPMNRFSLELQQDIRLCGPSDIAKRKHEMWDWIRDHIQGPWFVNLMITDVDDYLLGQYQKIELEEAHFVFRDKGEAIRFKLTWG